MRELKIPSSKSHTIRALYFSLFSSRTCIIKNYLDCNDTNAMLKAMELFGVRIKKKNNFLEIEPTQTFLTPKEPIDAQNSGLVFRFMTAFSSLFDKEIIISGDASIQKRRIIHPLVDAIVQAGAEIEFLSPPNHAPLRIRGPIIPGSFYLDGQDSQPVSALLMTLLFLEHKSIVHVKNPQECSWIDLTLAWIKRIGGLVLCDEYKKYTIYPLNKLQGFETQLHSDYSSATYPMTYAILKGVALKIHGLDKNDEHPDKGFFEILNRLGANVDFFNGYCGKKIELSGGTFNINHCIDTLPLLCLVGAFCKSPLKLIGAGICKYKESNRIKAMSSELTKMGVKIQGHADGCTIFTSKLKASSTSSFEDHRIAMTLFVANKIIGSEPKIDNLECIEKSYPSFIKDMASL